MNSEQKIIFSLFLEWPQGSLEASSSDPWGHSKKSENTIFAPNSLVFEIHFLKSENFHTLFLEST